MSDASNTLNSRVLLMLDKMSVEFDELAYKLGQPEIVVDHKKVREISIQKAALAPVVECYRGYRKSAAEAAELRKAIESNSDPDFTALAREELPSVESHANQLLGRVKEALVTTEDRKVGSVMMEVRAGTGGDEAALWARDLFEMYQRYSSKKGWSFEPLDITLESDAGGIKSAVANIRGEGVWAELNFEAGVHSVKRVPATEAQGRIHTSTATVAVLPEPDEVDVKIDWINEVEEFATRAQGPGGQNVNKVETAWQIHHKPSGIIIKMMEAKSQQQNRERARRLLIARLYEKERQRQHAERSAARKGQIGSGDRSEKIRTYRYKEGIVADERLPGEYNLRDLISGDMTKIMHDLTEHEVARRLAEL